ncbi:MAG: hypothetical protein H6822_03750 [Planctomycetaceae bacterium]|nr:hypothetical protein [Planctomycetales bacterium]MCB9921270.1 hypothetical protein [Planctomycetaceae bacterium]
MARYFSIAIESDELLVEGNGTVKGSQLVVSRKPTAASGSEHVQSALSQPFRLTHSPENESNSHSQLPQPPVDELDDELEDEEEGKLEDELEDELGVELDDELEELELLMLIPLNCAEVDQRATRSPRNCPSVDKLS